MLVNSRQIITLCSANVVEEVWYLYQMDFLIPISDCRRKFENPIDGHFYQDKYRLHIPLMCLNNHPRSPMP